MALPTTRNETATPANPVSSNLINAIQDQIIGNKKPALVRTTLPGTGNLGSWSYPVGQLYLLSAAGGNATVIPLFAEVGDRITSCRISAFGDGVVDVTYTLFKIPKAMTGTTQLATLTDSNRAAAWGDVTLTVTPTQINADEALYLVASANAANARIGVISYGYDRL